MTVRYGTAERTARLFIHNDKWYKSLNFKELLLVDVSSQIMDKDYYPWINRIRVCLNILFPEN